MADFRSRRQVLRSGVALGSIAVAGCLDGPLDTSGSPNGTTNGTGKNGSPPNSSGSGEPDWETIERWPQYQFDAKNTGYAHAEAGIDAIEEQWAVEFDDALGQSPVVADGTVYLRVGTGSAAAVEDGEILWSKEIGADSLLGLPVVGDDVVAFPAEDRKVGLDRADGSEVWEYSPEGSPLNPILVDGTVVFPNDSNEVYALDVETGEEQWAEHIDHGGYPGYPALYDGEVFLPNSGGGPLGTDQITAFDFEDGGHRPVLQTELRIRTLTIRGDTAYIGANDGVHAFSMDGDHLWHYPTDERVNVGLAVTEDFVLALSKKDLDGQLHAISIEGGEQQWTKTTERADVAPVIVGDAVFFAKGLQRIAASDLESGQEVWTAETVFGTRQIAFTNGRYYLPASEGTLYCFGTN